MAYNYPYGDTQQLNLNWFLAQWETFREQWATAEEGIDHALDAEIARVEAAMTDLYAARDAAAASQAAAQTAAVNAASSQTVATQQASLAQSQAATAQNQAQIATAAAEAAGNSASSASNSASNANLSKVQAGNSATAAGQSATLANDKATAAGLSAAQAGVSATNAAGSAEDSEAWAVGERGGSPVASGDDTYENNSKYYADQAATVAASIPADYTELSDDVSELKTAITQLADGKIVVNYTRILNKGFKVADGTFPDENGWDITDFIPVTAGETLHVSNLLRSHVYNGWYRSDKTYIGNFSIPIGDDIELLVPNDAAYVVLTNSHSDFDYIIWHDPTGLVTQEQFAPAQSIIEQQPYYATGIYISSQNKVLPETNAAKTLVYPLKNGHRYVVIINNGNRGKVCLSDNYKPVLNETLTLADESSGTDLRNSAYSFANTNNKKYMYAYCYNGATEPENLSYSILDLTEDIKPDNVNHIQGLYYSTGQIKEGADTSLWVFPVIPNTNYLINIQGGNRRAIALGNRYDPIKNDSATQVAAVLGTEEYNTVFNSGNNQFVYVYAYTTGSSQDFDAKIELNVFNASNGLDKVYQYTEYHSSGNTANVGIPFTIGCYNAAKFNNDSQIYISNEKIHNLKEAIAELDADVLIVNEDTGYIDSASTKSSHDYVFQPVYPFVYGSTNEKIYSKIGFATTENKKSPNNRYVSFATISVQNKTILIVCVHAVPGIEASNVTERAEDLAWLITEIGNKTFDYLVMGGDFNPEKGADDLTTMETAFSNANMIMCNGGQFDYLNTWFDPNARYNNVVARAMPLDYVITSNNVICNRFKTYTENFYDLYSDHVPIVANLTLLVTT